MCLYHVIYFFPNKWVVNARRDVTRKQFYRQRADVVRRCLGEKQTNLYNIEKSTGEKSLKGHNNSFVKFKRHFSFCR